MVQNIRRLIKLPEVKHQVALGRSAIYQKVRSGEFPAPIKLGARAVAWDSDAVNAWVESRIGAGGVK